MEDDTIIEGEVLEFHDDYIVLQSPSKSTLRKGPEVGSAGNKHINMYLGGAEYNKKLSGTRGFKVYDQMRRSDPVVRRTLRVAKTPILAGRWFVEANSPEQNEMREFIEWCLFENMGSNWTIFIKEVLTMLDFGFSTFEKVYRTKKTPFGTMTVLEDLAPRLQTSVMQFEYNNKGRPTAMKMYNYNDKPVTIRYRKLLAFTYDKVGYNIEGISLLRSAYKPWFFKGRLEKLDAAQKERHGIGIPIIKLPPGAVTDKDLKAARNMGQSLRANPSAYIILPARWEVEWAKLEGLPVDILESIKYHDMAMEKNILADFLSTTSSDSGTDTKADIFLKSSRDLANIIYEEINRNLIQELINYNYGEQLHYPKLKVRRVSDEVSSRVLSFALKNIVSSDIIRPDEDLENWWRNELSLPAKDGDTERQPIVNNRQGQDNSGKSQRE